MQNENTVLQKATKVTEVIVAQVNGVCPVVERNFGVEESARGTEADAYYLGWPDEEETAEPKETKEAQENGALEIPEEAPENHLTPCPLPGAERERTQERVFAGSGELRFEEVHPWPEPVNAAALLDDLETVMKRFVVLPKYAAEALALWTLHTYAFHLREVSTYLGIESPEKQCGKTTLLSLLSELVRRPVTSANISPSAVFRVIEELQPTLLIDEGDTFLNGNDELRGILNSGYTRKTAYVVRVGKEVKTEGEGQGAEARVKKGSTKGSRLMRFSCWCPKVIAMIGRLPDTLADRCIVIRMQRKLQGEDCDRLKLLEPAPLRQKCVRFVADNAAAIASARPKVPTSLSDRAGDVWEPLFVLADLAGGAWPEKARHAAVALAGAAQESSPIGALLLDILSCFVASRSDRLFSRTVAAHLNHLSNRPWAELRNGKPITEVWLSHQLRPYGIRPRTLWIGEAQGKGYMQEDFGEVFRRYVPGSEVEALAGGSRE